MYDATGEYVVLQTRQASQVELWRITDEGQARLRSFDAVSFDALNLSLPIGRKQ